MTLLNVKALTDLLSQNSDGKLCRRSWLMTINGTLLAYSRPVGVNDLRQQAAMVALYWQEWQSKPPAPSINPRADGVAELPPGTHRAPLSLLIVESDTHNLIIRGIQEHLVLVLEGGTPTRQSSSKARIIAEDAQGVQSISFRHRREEHHIPIASSPSSNGSTAAGDEVAPAILRLQREKLNGLADVISAEFECTGFKLPQLANTSFF